MERTILKDHAQALPIRRASTRFTSRNRYASLSLMKLPRRTIAAALAAVFLAFASSLAVFSALAQGWRQGPLQPAQTTDTTVDLELILAVDISLSMDMDELRVQRSGYTAALRDPEVQKSMLDGPRGRIAVAYFEWAGQAIQLPIATWTLIDSPQAANALADLIDRAPISRHRFTSISGAMLFAERQFDQSPWRSIRRVLDISGDGPNNNGPPVTDTRERLLDQGIVINGLPLILKQGGSVFDLANLDIYYSDCVIGGPASFVIPVKSIEEFAPAIRRKILLEVAGIDPPAQVIRTQGTPQPDAPRIDCLIGEKMWRRYMEGGGWMDR